MVQDKAIFFDLAEEQHHPARIALGLELEVLGGGQAAAALEVQGQRLLPRVPAWPPRGEHAACDLLPATAHRADYTASAILGKLRKLNIHAECIPFANTLGVVRHAAKLSGATLSATSSLALFAPGARQQPGIQLRAAAQQEGGALASRALPALLLREEDVKADTFDRHGHEQRLVVPHQDEAPLFAEDAQLLLLLLRLRRLHEAGSEPRASALLQDVCQVETQAAVGGTSLFLARALTLTLLLLVEQLHQC